MQLNDYIKTLETDQKKQLARELKYYVEGRPSLGLRMQDDFPEQFFEIGDRLTKEHSNKITLQNCIDALKL